MLHHIRPVLRRRVIELARWFDTRQYLHEQFRRLGWAQWLIKFVCLSIRNRTRSHHFIKNENVYWFSKYLLCGCQILSVKYYLKTMVNRHPWPSSVMKYDCFDIVHYLIEFFTTISPSKVERSRMIRSHVNCILGVFKRSKYLTRKNRTGEASLGSYFPVGTQLENGRCLDAARTVETYSRLLAAVPLIIRIGKRWNVMMISTVTTLSCMKTEKRTYEDINNKSSFTKWGAECVENCCEAKGRIGVVNALLISKIVEPQQPENIVSMLNKDTKGVTQLFQ